MTDKLETKTDRRRFLRGAAGVGGGLIALSVGCGEKQQQDSQNPAEPCTTPPKETAAPKEAGLPDGLDASKFHMHTSSPLTLETKRSSFGFSPITPTALFFVRNNLPMPDRAIVADPDAWTLEVTGVKQPRKLTVAELKKMAVETITSVVQCSGNGRKFSKHGPSGSQWATGAAGCAMWTGVRVRDVVEMLGGAVAGMKFMTSTGGEELPEGVDPLTVVVERSIPIEKGMLDCMLVWEMNGMPVPITHGGPLRLIVPGYYGCNQIKYIKRLGFTAEQTQAKIQKTGYRFRAIGEKGNPSQPSMWRMNVKSWINGPGADDEPVLQGKIQFHGVALSGERTIANVEASLDGKTWRSVRMIGPDLGASAWRAFTFEAELTPGKHMIYTRATDDAGETQPEERADNERGYGNNSWRDHGLEITVVDKMPEKKAQAATATTYQPGGRVNAKDSAKLSEEGKKGKALLTGEAQPPCGTCHTVGDADVHGTVGPNLDELQPTAEQVEAAITNGVGVMPPYKGMLSEDKIKLIARYVAEATK